MYQVPAAEMGSQAVLVPEIQNEDCLRKVSGIGLNLSIEQLFLNIGIELTTGGMGRLAKDSTINSSRIWRAKARPDLCTGWEGPLCEHQSLPFFLPLQSTPPSSLDSSREGACAASLEMF